MVFSSQVWAGANRLLRKKLIFKNGLVSSCNHSRLHSPPKKSGISSYCLGLDDSSTVILRQTEKISVQVFTPWTTHPLSHPSC